MTTNLKAIYEQGVLRLKEPLSLPDGTQVDVTVTSHEEDNGEPSQKMDSRGTPSRNSWPTAKSTPESPTSPANTITTYMAFQKG